MDIDFGGLARLLLGVREFPSIVAKCPQSWSTGLIFGATGAAVDLEGSRGQDSGTSRIPDSTLKSPKLMGAPAGTQASHLTNPSPGSPIFGLSAHWCCTATGRRVRLVALYTASIGGPFACGVFVTSIGRYASRVFEMS